CHRLGIEQAVELIARHQTAIANEIVNIAPALERFLRDLGRRFVAEYGYESGDHANRLLDEASHTFSVRGDSFNAAVLKNFAGASQVRHSGQQSERYDRLEHVELNLPP